MIDDITKQKILDAADIYEVISDYVSLKKRGVNYVGCCPFHNEKTGSFTVSTSKGIYKCFGCGKGGDVVHFVMEHEQINYYEALKRLAERYHIKVEERELSAKELQERGDKESMNVLNSFAQKFFYNQLTTTEEGKTVGLGYFYKRGLDMDVIDKFGLGYNPSGWDKLTQAALAAGYHKEYLLKTGLSTETQKGTLVDRFHDRVMFPIKDATGKVIAFGGRIMTNDKKAAKYQNSPESEIYHKKSTLYGIDLARASIVRKNICYLVEGYLDVISFHMRGIENVVASSGTSLTVEQILMIRRLTPNVTVMYDGDAAGIHAALRGIDLLLKEGLNVRVVLLPDGEDPDSYAQNHSTDQVLEYISENEVDFISFKARLLLKDVGTDPIARANAISDVMRTIALVPDNIARSVYTRSCSEIMKISEHELSVGISRILRSGVSEPSPIKTKDAESTGKNEQDIGTIDVPNVATMDTLCNNEEKELVRGLLLYGMRDVEIDGDKVNIAHYILDDLDEEGLELFNKELWTVLDEYRKNIGVKGFEIVRIFQAQPDSSVSSVVADVLSDRYELSKIWAKNGDVAEELNDVELFELITKLLNNYKLKRVSIRIKQIDKKIKEMGAAGNADMSEILSWLKRKKVLNDVRTTLVRAMKRTAVQ